MVSPDEFEAACYAALTREPLPAQKRQRTWDGSLGHRTARLTGVLTFPDLNLLGAPGDRPGAPSTFQGQPVS